MKIFCRHNRHRDYYENFTSSNRDERQYYLYLAKYVMDADVSPLDGDDLEFFQDVVFESPYGRIHIYFYEQLFENYYEMDPDWCILVFNKYLDYLERISPLFTVDAINFIFRENDLKLVEKMLGSSSYEIKMRLIRASENHPDLIKSVPKLKLYNLFS